MVPIRTERGGAFAALVIGLSWVAATACGGKVDEGGAGGGATSATGGGSTSEGGSGGVSTGGRAEGGLTGAAGDEEGDGSAVAATGGSATGGAATDGSGGAVTPAGGAPEPSSGGAAAGTMGGSAGGEVAGGGTSQAGATSATGGGGISGGLGGLGGVAGTAGSEGGSAGVDCTLVGCSLAWCGEPCQSPCGCCPCPEGSVDAEGNRCQDGCWLRTAGDAHCRLPWDPGPCDSVNPMFWFDAATNRCEPRTYGGCEGNANRFGSLADCEQDCAQIPGPSDEPLPVVHAFGDRCGGDTLTEAGRGIVTEFVGARSHEPPEVDPYILVDLMAGNDVCSRMSDIDLDGTGVAAFVDYHEYGEVGYLPLHLEQVPTDAITSELSELSVALGVEPAQVVWR